MVCALCFTLLALIKTFDEAQALNLAAFIVLIGVIFTDLLFF